MSKDLGTSRRPHAPFSGQSIRSDVAAAARSFIESVRTRAEVVASRLEDVAADGFPTPGSRFWQVLKRLAQGAALALVLFFAVTAGVAVWAWQGGPLEFGEPPHRESALLLEADDGTPIGRIGPLRATADSIDEFPPHLIQAVLGIEDRRFYNHFGIDPVGIGRALGRNINARAVVEGGSTITQQLVKLGMGGAERTYRRKLREVFGAIWLEMQLDKDEILLRYLNSIYTGSGAYGMKSAARVYFDKEPAALSLKEAAVLAGLIKAPSLFNPLRDIETADQRAAVVLDAMVETGAIDNEAAGAAKREPIVVRRPAVASEANNWFADWAAEEAVRVTDSFGGNTRVRTTILADVQRVAERVVRESLILEGAAIAASQAALVAMRPDGSVIAMVGGRDYEKNGVNRAVQTRRKSGSAFMLFVHLAALRKGFSLHDTIEDAPVEINGWSPQNSDGTYHGPVTLADAFVQSRKAAGARLALDIGSHIVIETARELGIVSPITPLQSLALGTAELNLVELTGAYAAVRAGYAPILPWGVSAVGPEGKDQLFSTNPARTVRSRLEYREEMIELLREAVERGTGQAAALDEFTAGKTGTSEDYRDAWFIGFNHNIVAGVWVGNDDGAPMDGVTGGTLAARIWKAFVSEANALLEPEAPESPIVADVWPRPEPQSATESKEAQQAAETPGEPAAASEVRHAAASLQARAQPEAQAPSRRSTPVPIENASASCDLQACSSRYRSFRSSDCTYQPYRGGRELCPIGSTARVSNVATAAGTTSNSRSSSNPATASSTTATSDSSTPVSNAFAAMMARMTGQNDAEPAGGRCNIEVCEKSYNSFRAADCSYQPYGGGARRVCNR